MMAMPQPVTNPFGTLPAMPQMSIGRSAGSGPSVQYGISSMPVSARTRTAHPLFVFGDVGPNLWLHCEALFRIVLFRGYISILLSSLYGEEGSNEMYAHLRLCVSGVYHHLKEQVGAT